MDRRPLFLALTALLPACPSTDGDFGSARPDDELSPCGAPIGTSHVLRGLGFLTGADHYNCALPAEVEGAPAFTSFSGTTQVAQGGRTGLLLDWDGAPENIAGRGVVVSIDQEPGWFRADADRPERPFPVELWVQADAAPGEYTIRLAIDDGTGNAADPHPGAGFSFPLQVVAAGTGDLQVTVSWDTDADVDISVVDPLGQQIWWGAPSTPEGGVLDLDSNAGCEPGVRNENVHWPAGAAPQGDYRVFTNLWDACGAQGTTRLRFTVSEGTTPILTEDVFLEPGEANPSEGPPDREVATFAYPDTQ